MSFEKRTSKTEAAAEKAAKKTAAKAKKAPAKKDAAPKAARIQLKVQYMGKEVSQEEMVAAVKAQLGELAVETMELYVKPEDNTVYYVVNGDITGKVAF